MYPLKLSPLIKDYLWGGTKLKTDFDFETVKEIAAEAWMLSCHKDGMNVVMNGEHKGKTINEVLDIWGKGALGKNADNFSYFPILIKLIDAKQKLSVQVHPNDDYALAVEGEYGKTEMWYVVECEQGAEIIYGFKKDISGEEFERRIKDNTLMEVCNSVPVEKGDVFFIEAGTLHAIGEGILIAEVQQNSNTTYRVSDYGRLGADGKPRELHIDKALAVTKCETPKIPYGKVGSVKNTANWCERQLANCEYFKTSKLDLHGVKYIQRETTCVSLLILEGEIIVKFNNDKFIARKGNSIFIPRKCKTQISGNAEIIVTTF
ncbi:MAG: class I mannose-6-phosphate isomerase [Lachnospiraceae bacterium]|nr:class I mannose-6-phosphate isomerase [Lachnospiraceae bacterium]